MSTTLSATAREFVPNNYKAPLSAAPADLPPPVETSSVKADSESPSPVKKEPFYSLVLFGKDLQIWSPTNQSTAWESVEPRGASS